jgi:hypothetical protein
MKLTEFLLARIAEDEAAAQAVVDELAFLGLPRTRGRALAECEAKRQIVEDEVLRYCDNVPPSGFVSPEVADSIRSRADSRTLRHLAAIYADHSDYRQEWKP